MKKSLFAIVGLFLFSFNSFAQISVTPYFRVDASNFLMTPSKEMKLEYGITTQMNQKFKLNYTYGFDVNYDFSPKWSLKTGLMYQEMGSRSGQAYYFEDNVFKSWEREISHKIISIPIQAQYNFRADKRFSPYIALGGAVGLNTYNSIKTTYFDEQNNVSNITDFELLSYAGGMPRKFNISAKADFGFNYKLTEKLSLNMFMSGNMLLTPSTQNVDFNNRHFNIGTGLGLKYSF
jgi:long-subunit fatty acid transport protein